jgi:hypothetical protein
MTSPNTPITSSVLPTPFHLLMQFVAGWLAVANYIATLMPNTIEATYQCEWASRWLKGKVSRYNRTN